MTTDTFAFDQRPVRIDIEDVWLRPGLGVHELRLALKLHAPWLPAQPSNAGAVLSVQAAVDVEVANQHGPLGHAGATYTVRLYPTNETLSLLLTDEQLLALESGGSQDGLRLLIDLTSTLFSSTSASVTTTNQMRHHVTRNRWFELLDQAGTAVAVTVRVPSPLTDPTPSGHLAPPGSPSASQAALRLRQARRALADGDHERCVQTCRAVLEHVKVLQPLTPANALAPIAASKRDADQRWSALFHDTYSLVSAASHDDENTLGFHWTRRDAQAVLALTAGLLARVHPAT
jgi:hypothetical protein